MGALGLWVPLPEAPCSGRPSPSPLVSPLHSQAWWSLAGAGGRTTPGFSPEFLSGDMRSQVRCEEGQSVTGQDGQVASVSARPEPEAPLLLSPRSFGRCCPVPSFVQSLPCGSAAVRCSPDWGTLWSGQGEGSTHTPSGKAWEGH